MAGALAQGFVRSGLVRPDQILASDPIESAREAFTAATKATTTLSNREVAEFGRVLIIAVKPHQVGDLLREIKPSLNPDHLIVSIAAGITLRALEAAGGAGTRFVRVMPNTPALVGASASAYSLGAAARPEDGHLVNQLLSSVGTAYPVNEPLLDAVTGLSGSGPAYACLIMEALSDAGVAMGLPRETATRLAAQTLLGTAQMVLQTGLHPAVLKDMVTSPGGTTIDGLYELEKAGVRAGLISAVRVATEKSKKLGQS